MAERATAAPWVRDQYDDPSMQVIAYGNEVIVYHWRHPRQADARVVANHELIVALRNNLPALLSLAKDAGRYRAALETIVNNPHGANFMGVAEIAAAALSTPPPAEGAER